MSNTSEHQELNGQVARALGWEPCVTPVGAASGAFDDPDGYHHWLPELPNYAGDIAAAFSLVEWANKRGWILWNLQQQSYGPYEVWSAEFTRPSRETGPHAGWEPAQAVARAFVQLAAIEAENAAQPSPSMDSEGGAADG
jgi:hypothetical protein